MANNGKLIFNYFKLADKFNRKYYSKNVKIFKHLFLYSTPANYHIVHFSPIHIFNLTINTKLEGSDDYRIYLIDSDDLGSILEDKCIFMFDGNGVLHLGLKYRVEPIVLVNGIGSIDELKYEDNRLKGIDKCLKIAKEFHTNSERIVTEIPLKYAYYDTLLFDSILTEFFKSIDKYHLYAYRNNMKMYFYNDSGITKFFKTLQAYSLIHKDLSNDLYFTALIANIDHSGKLEEDISDKVKVIYDTIK